MISLTLCIFNIVVAPQPCREYYISPNYIDALFEDRLVTIVYQASICLGNMYGDLCYSPYFTDELATDFCRNNIYNGFMGKYCNRCV